MAKKASPRRTTTTRARGDDGACIKLTREQQELLDCIFQSFGAESQYDLGLRQGTGITLMLAERGGARRKRAAASRVRRR